MSLCAKRSTLWIPFSSPKDAQESERIIQHERNIIEQQPDLRRQLKALLKQHKQDGPEK